MPLKNATASVQRHRAERPFDLGVAGFKFRQIPSVEGLRLHAQWTRSGDVRPKADTLLAVTSETTTREHVTCISKGPLYNPFLFNFLMYSVTLGLPRSAQLHKSVLSG